MYRTQVYWLCIRVVCVHVSWSAALRVCVQLCTSAQLASRCVGIHLWSDRLCQQAVCGSHPSRSHAAAGVHARALWCREGDLDFHTGRLAPCRPVTFAHLQQGVVLMRSASQTRRPCVFVFGHACTAAPPHTLHPLLTCSACAAPTPSTAPTPTTCRCRRRLVPLPPPSLRPPTRQPTGVATLSTRPSRHTARGCSKTWTSNGPPRQRHGRCRRRTAHGGEGTGDIQQQSQANK